MISTENEINYSKILKCAMDVGEHMVVSGSEVGRVEEGIIRMCKAYGAVRVDVLTITSSIITTIETPDGECITQTRRITSRNNDLMRIEALNRLLRKICETRPSIEEIEAELKKIYAMKPMRWYVYALANVIIAATFAVFFGGTWRDALATLFPALVVVAIELFAVRLKSNKIVFNLIASIAAGAVCVASVRLGVGENLNFIMIGVIMLLIPGMAMTGAIEDLLTGDTITGLLRLCEAIIAACAIAAGFAVSIYFCNAVELIDLANAGDPNKLIQLLMAALSACAFSMRLGVKRPTRLCTAALGGLVCWGGYLIAVFAGCDDFAACFIAAIVGALYSQIMARTVKATASVFLVPAVIPLVPGRALYYTFSSIMHGETELISRWGATTALEALAIALGIVVVLISVSAVVAIVRRIKFRRLH